MKTLRVAVAACGLALAALATPAAAQTVVMTCTFTYADAYSRSNDGSITNDGAQAGPVSELRVDLSAGTFTLGGTSGDVLAEPTRIIGMSRAGQMFGIWEISRVNGQIDAVGAMSDDSMTSFYRATAQCARPDGTTRF